MVGILNYHSSLLTQRGPLGAFRHWQGLRLSDSFAGDVNHSNTRVFNVPSSNASAIFRGDLVYFVGATGDDLYQDQFTFGGPQFGNNAWSPQVALYAPGDTTHVLAGVVVGFELTLAAAKASQNYLPASQEGWVRVCVDPNAIYYVTSGGVAIPAGGWSANVGAGIDMLAANTTYQSLKLGQSGRSVDPTTVGTTTTLPLKITGVPYLPLDDITNAPTGTPGSTMDNNPVIAVTLNNARHFLSGQANFV